MPIVKPAKANAATVAARLRTLENAKQTEETRGTAAVQQSLTDGSAFVGVGGPAPDAKTQGRDDWFVEVLQAHFVEHPPQTISHAQARALRAAHDIAASETLVTTSTPVEPTVVLTGNVRNAVRAIQQLEAGLQALEGTELSAIVSPDYLVELKEGWRSSAEIDFEAVTNELRAHKLRDWNRNGELVNDASGQSTETFLHGMTGPPEFLGAARDFEAAMRNLADDGGRAVPAAWHQANDAVDVMLGFSTSDPRLSAFLVACKQWFGPSLELLDAFPDLRLPKRDAAGQ